MGQIFSAFAAGADGVIVSGCHPGECHYLTGNLRAEEQIERLQRLLDIIGFDPRRLRLQWVSASEGQLFADYMSEFTELIRTLGPSPIPRAQPQGSEAPAPGPGPTEKKAVVTP